MFVDEAGLLFIFLLLPLCLTLSLVRFVLRLLHLGRQLASCQLMLAQLISDEESCITGLALESPLQGGGPL